MLTQLVHQVQQLPWGQVNLVHSQQEIQPLVGLKLKKLLEQSDRKLEQSFAQVFCW